MIRERDRTEPVIISPQEGKTYADLLRTVKETIKDDKETTSHIQTIRQSKEGNMVITMKPEQRKADELKNLLTRGMKEMKARISKRDKRGGAVLNVKGMDAVTTKAEVVEAIGRESGVGANMVRVGELRPFFGGSQAVRVTMPEEAAKKLLQTGGIRIAYNNCRVTRRFPLTQCFKCWGYGHTASECEEAHDHGKDCRKCGRTGHVLKDCTNEKYCPICKNAGHSVGIGACPDMRRALKIAREAEDSRREVEKTKLQTEEETPILTIKQKVTATTTQ